MCMDNPAFIVSGFIDLTTGPEYKMLCQEKWSPRWQIENHQEGKSIISLKEKMFFLSSTINIKFAVHFGEEPSKSLWFGVFGFCFTDKGDTALPEAVACFGDLKLFGEASATEGVCETVLLIFLLFFSSRLFFDVDARLKSCLPLISF